MSFQLGCHSKLVVSRFDGILTLRVTWLLSWRTFTTFALRKLSIFWMLIHVVCHLLALFFVCPLFPQTVQWAFIAPLLSKVVDSTWIGFLDGTSLQSSSHYNIALADSAVASGFMIKIWLLWALYSLLSPFKNWNSFCSSCCLLYTSPSPRD